MWWRSHRRCAPSARQCTAFENLLNRPSYASQVLATDEGSSLRRRTAETSCCASASAAREVVAGLRYSSIVAGCKAGKPSASPRTRQPEGTERAAVTAIPRPARTARLIPVELWLVRSEERRVGEEWVSRWSR